MHKTALGLANCELMPPLHLCLSVKFQMMNVGSEVRLQTVHGNFQGIVHGLNRRERFVSLRDGASTDC